MTKTDKIFMAFGAGRESTEVVGAKRYIGVAPVYVLAVNPSKKELEDIYGRELEKDVVYTSEVTINDKQVKQVRIDFLVKTDAEVTNVDLTTKISFFINKEYQFNSNKDKIQMINKYGETTWIPIENVKPEGVILPETLSWFDPAGIRPAYMGEELLTHFIKTYLNIPAKSYTKKSGEVVTIANLSDAEAQLENIAKYFDNDFQELKNIIKLQPKNKIKCVFGVKTNDDNALYQAVYTKKFLKNNVSDYSKIQSDIRDAQSNGAFKNTVFDVCPIKEYTIEKTDFEKEAVEDLPFGSTTGPWKAPV